MLGSVVAALNPTSVQFKHFTPQWNHPPTSSSLSEVEAWVCQSNGDVSLILHFVCFGSVFQSTYAFNYTECHIYLIKEVYRHAAIFSQLPYLKEVLYVCNAYTERTVL